MRVRFRKFGQKTLEDLPGSIFSPALEDGTMPSTSPDGETALSGQDLALASHSRQRASRRATKTNATSGPKCSGSSASADLQRSLENKSRERFGTDGSILFKETWKRRVTPSGVSYLEHTARALRTSDSVYTGWLTPRVNDPAEDPAKSSARLQDRNSDTCTSLSAQAVFLSGWPTPMANKLTPQTREDFTPNLPAIANLAGWLTPDCSDRRSDKSKQKGVSNIAKLSSWRTPAASDGEGGSKDIMDKEKLGSSPKLKLRDQSLLAPWATPTTRDHKDGEECPNVPENSLLGRQVWQASGQIANGSLAGTENRGHARQLNPALSCWLMGFGIEWMMCYQYSLRKP